MSIKTKCEDCGEQEADYICELCDTEYCEDCSDERYNSCDCDAPRIIKNER